MQKHGPHRQSNVLSVSHNVKEACNVGVLQAVGTADLQHQPALGSIFAAVIVASEATYVTNSAAMSQLCGLEVRQVVGERLGAAQLPQFLGSANATTIAA